MDDETNVGVIDRIIRFVVGLGILVAAQLVPASIFVQALMIVVGAIVMVTGAAGFCLMYKMFGISTYKPKH